MKGRFLMRVGDVILQAFCKDPGTGDCHGAPIPVGEELALLRREYTQFSSLVHGKKVADFGCGLGLQSIALVREEDCVVTGIDTSVKNLQKAKQSIPASGIDPRRIQFVDRPTSEMWHIFDVVISLNSMEHFSEPEMILQEMKELVRPGGLIMISFGSAWLSPRGSHMEKFCPLPWLNILFDEQTVMRARSRYSKDGAMRYVDVAGGLNKMTLAKFEGLIKHSGVKVFYKRSRAIKGWNFLTKLPLLREFFTTQMSIIACLPNH
jgi:SAM-dependent methyltransferase